MAHLPGKFVWFEHVSPDPARAQAFYGGLCAWTVQSMPMGGQTYDMIMNGEQAIGGWRSADTGVATHWASYLSVPDVDKSVMASTAAGATLVMPPTAFGDVGRGAAIQDPSGAMVCLWKNAQGDPQDAANTPFGNWFWNELWSTDVKAATAFYAKALGHTIDTMDMGPQGTYYILKDGGGAMRAGAMQQAPDASMPSFWLPYIHVADCDAAGAMARELGAVETIVPPTDIPGIGRFTVIIDPLGAPIGLIKGAG